MFRNPDEWRRAREAALALLDERLTLPRGESPGQTFDRLYPCPPEPAKWPEMSSGSCFSVTPPNTMAFNAPPTRPAPAEVEAAVKQLEQVVYDAGYEGGFTDGYTKARDAARARLLALYAEPVGEVYEVQDEPNLPGPMVLLPHGPYLKGQRVRVTRVEGEA